MPFNVLESITQEERLNFSQDFSVKRPGILDTIFPDVKTQYLKAEYYRLMAGQRLPEVAFVHALDTEAEIGTRPGFEKVLTEKLFIKRKINQSERLQQAIENGVPDNEALKNFVFDDAANLFEGVVARANVMKGQFLSTGAVKVKENNVDLNIDYGVPTGAKVTLTDWSSDYVWIDWGEEKTVAETWKATGTATSTVDDLYIRETPNGYVLGQINKGNRVEINGEKSGMWTKVKVAGIGIGWAATKYLQVDRAKSKPTTITNKQNKTQRLFVGKVTATSTDVRTWAGGNYPSIKKCPKLVRGNLVDVMNFTQKATNGASWHYVRIEGKYYGFVAAKDICKV